MWINNQDRNYGINLSNGENIKITKYYSDVIESKISALTMFPRYPSYSPFGHTEEWNKRVGKYEIKKEENRLERKRLEETEQMYYKIVIDGITFAMYIDKEVAYSVYASVFRSIGINKEAFEMPKDIEGEDKI